LADFHLELGAHEGLNGANNYDAESVVAVMKNKGFFKLPYRLDARGISGRWTRFLLFQEVLFRLLAWLGMLMILHIPIAVLF
jgi:hypothetical protein